MALLIGVPNSNDLPPALYDSLLGFVSDNRKQRVKRFLRREDACRSIVGEVLAKYCVGKAAGIPAKTITFQVDSFGKPHANVERQIQFSVSHSKSWVACAVGSGPVGIDVEYMREFDSGIAERFFHPGEYAALVALPEERRKERFYDLWTIKESYIKALGKGLSLALDSFEILVENGRINMKAGEGLPVMKFKQYDLGAEYKCAVCAVQDDFPERIDGMSPEELCQAVGA
jgi:4'-phosphopantetheinyl transferase